ncbi:MAG: non-canonical purine NTP pyrophosphatase [Bacilli bacterium]|nr:non-canonical purine NTP pyrophosphatase [Bacilli bacterium]
MKITYVTGNKAKIDSARMYLEPLGIEVDNIKMEIDEIQSDTCEDVVIHSVKEAYKKVKHPVLKNDSGLFIESLNGFPGVYTHCVEDTIGEDGILKLMEDKTNRNAKFIEVYAYMEDEDNIKIFTSVTKGTISYNKSGTYGWSYDYIFIPEGKEKTLANYKDSERYKLWDDTGLKELSNYLKENKHD